MPLDTRITGAPGDRKALSCFAVLRTAKDGVASTTAPQSFTLARSVVSSRASGRATPGSMGFSRFSRRVACSCPL